LPSRIFNKLANLLGGVHLHDQNCGFKCFHRRVVEQLSLCGEMHRLIPSIAAMSGFRSTEIVVTHHPRRAGRSKYGLERLLRGFGDLMTVGFLRRFRQRPSHFFNAMALVHVCVGIGLAGGTLYLGCHTSIALFVACTTLMQAVALFSQGIVAELFIRGPLAIAELSPIAFDTGITTHLDRPAPNHVNSVPLLATQNN
jgi:hypothetical protein